MDLVLYGSMQNCCSLNWTALETENEEEAAMARGLYCTKALKTLSHQTQQVVD